MILKNMITLETLQLFKEMVTNWLFTRLSLFQGTLEALNKALSKQQKVDADPKSIQQITFTVKPEKNVTVFFIIEEEKETILDFSKKQLKYYDFISF